MKVVFLTHRISNAVTGGEIYNTALLEAAEKDNISVEKWEGEKYPSFKKSLLIMNLIYLVKTLIENKDTVFIYDTDYHARYIISLFWARHIKKVKCVGMLHHFNYLARVPSFKRSIQKVVEKIVASQYSHLIVNTPFCLRCFHELTQKKVTHFLLEPFTNVSHNNSKNYLRKKPSSPLKILTVGTVEFRKNQDSLIKACIKLNTPFEIHIVGKSFDTDYIDHLKSLIQKFNLNESIKFHGAVDNKKLTTFYTDSDIFVLVSRFEGYGMVYAEAMRFGLPIVASTSGAVPDLVSDNENGILCDPENVDEIFNAITKIIDHKIYRKFSSNNIERSNTLVTREIFIEKSKSIFKTLFENER